MLHGAERNAVDLTFSIPSECARQLEDGRIDVGLVPVAEIARQSLEIMSDVGIASNGAVRSILLFSRVPWRSVQTLAADASSRTSVQLAKVILSECFGATPAVTEFQPVLSDMLSVADAALVIGDPALRLEPDSLGYEWLDLGAEWTKLTSLPMVFAAWAAAKTRIPQLSPLLRSSFEFGQTRLGEIAGAEYQKREVSKELAYRYLSEHIRFVLGAREMEGLRTFLHLTGLRKGKDAFATTSY